MFWYFSLPVILVNGGIYMMMVLWDCVFWCHHSHLTVVSTLHEVCVCQSRRMWPCHKTVFIQMDSEGVKDLPSCAKLTIEYFNEKWLEGNQNFRKSYFPKFPFLQQARKIPLRIVVFREQGWKESGSPTGRQWTWINKCWSPSASPALLPPYTALSDAHRLVVPPYTCSSSSQRYASSALQPFLWTSLFCTASHICVKRIKLMLFPG